MKGEFQQSAVFRKKGETGQYPSGYTLAAEPGTEGYEKENSCLVSDCILWMDIYKELEDEFGESIKHILKRKHLTQEALAGMLGVSPKALYNYLNSDRPSLPHIVGICVAMSLPYYISMELIENAGYALRKSEIDFLYRQFLLQSEQISVDRCEDILQKQGYPPLFRGEGAVAINGGVGVMELRRLQVNMDLLPSVDDVMNSVAAVAAEIAENAHITLRELKTKIDAVTEKKLPKFAQLMAQNPVAVAQTTVNGATLTAYQKDGSLLTSFDIRDLLDAVEQCAGGELRQEIESYIDLNVEDIDDYVHDSYDLTPHGIIKRLGLLDVDYNKVSAYGHFGKAGLPWEE